MKSQFVEKTDLLSLVTVKNFKIPKFYFQTQRFYIFFTIMKMTLNDLQYKHFINVV